MAQTQTTITAEGREVLQLMSRGWELRVVGVGKTQDSALNSADESREIARDTWIALKHAGYIYMRHPMLGYMTLTVKGRKALANA